MDVRAAMRGRRAGTVALLTVLLCAFGMLAPAIARAHADAPVSLHTVNVVNLTSADQIQITVRVDQPIAAAIAPVTNQAAAPADSTTTASLITNSSTVDTARTRGPPTDAGSHQ
ncbi:MAG: hypothetical protein ABI232_10290 [Jatrophihabitantaceae bacterium]